MAFGETIETSGISQQLLDEGLDRAFVTRDGMAFFEENPGVFERFAESARELLGPNSQAARKDYQYLGSGRWAVVYQEEPGDEHCIKVSTPQDMAINRGVQRMASPPDLRVDLRFMNIIHHRLARSPDHGVHAPRQYAAVGLKQDYRINWALLQEKMPSGLVSIKSFVDALANDGDGGEDETATALGREIAGVIKARFGAALGSSALRLGVGDLMIGKTGRDAWIPNSRNIWVRADTPIEETDIHVVDLVRGQGLSRRAARLLGHLAA